MNRFQKTILPLCFCMFALAGCGSAKVPDTVDTTSIVMNEDGTVTSYVVDIFDKDYYNVDELRTMAAEEVAEYNEANTTEDNATKPKVTVEKIELLENTDKVQVLHQYDSAQTYADFNGSEFFYGTVGQAVAHGYDLDIDLIKANGTDVMNSATLKTNTEKKILITDVKAFIYCPKKVAYVSHEAVMNEDGSVDTTQSDSYIYILMK